MSWNLLSEREESRLKGRKKELERLVTGNTYAFEWMNLKTPEEIAQKKEEWKVELETITKTLRKNTNLKRQNTIMKNRQRKLESDPNYKEDEDF